MFISVIINTYNRKSSLSNTVESVLKQNYKEFELIVVDDGSTDGTEEALSRYIRSGRLKYVWQPNRGVAASRNLGIALSKGDYLSFLDSDIICSEQWLTKVVSTFKSDDSIGIVGTWPILGKYYGLKDKLEAAGPPGGESVVEVARVGGGVSTIRRELLDKIGKLDETFRFGWEDNELCWRAILCGFRILYFYDILTFHMKDLSDPSRLDRGKWIYENLKNKIYIYLKLMDLRTIFFVLLKELLKSVSLLKSLRLGISGVQAWLWNLENLTRTIRKRQEVSRLFTHSHDSLLSLISREKLLDRRIALYLHNIASESLAG